MTVDGASTLESALCPICGSANRAETPYRDEKNGVGVVRCFDCSLLYLSPRLTEERILAYYRDPEYFGGGDCGYASYERQERSLRLTFRRLLANLDRVGATGGSLLEVGCGFGYLLDEASPYFERRVGTDMSEDAALHARQRSDDVWVGGLEAVPAHLRFDRAIAVHVIEHVYDPRAFVRGIANRVRDGGHVILAAPDAGSFWLKISRRRWPSFKYPEHVAFYDRQSLSTLMRRCGLRDIRPVPYPHAFPVSDILDKLGLPCPGFMASRSAWLPATTVALIGTVR